MRFGAFPAAALTACAAVGCGARPTAGPADAPAPAGEVASDAPTRELGPLEGVQVRLDFTRAGDFYAAPWPSEDLRQAGGAVGLAGFPNPTETAFVGAVIDLVERDADGFGLTSGVFFSLTGPPARSPTAEHVALLGADPDSPDFLSSYPLRVGYQADGGPFGGPHLLSLVPVQGVPLLPQTLYVAVVTRALAPGRSQALADLLAGRAPPGLAGDALGAYQLGLQAAEKAGYARGDLAGLAVFRTGDPAAAFGAYRTKILALPLPALDTPLGIKEVFDSFCVFEGVLAMPTYQQGDPPFLAGGGGWGAEVFNFEPARLVVTLPRTPMPDSGFPLVDFIRTGGGGDRPLVDRGPHAVAGGPAAPGTGPALHFAAVGWAGASVDGPHGGLRNITGQDEQFLVFNVTNPEALRDNVRQSALEVVLAASLFETLSFDASACPGAPSLAHFDAARLALMGHSMGATIAPLAAAWEPRFRALILSGAGGSWIENIVHKLSPLEVRPLAEAILGYDTLGRELTIHDPVLSLLQWAGEPADPPVYARAIVEAPIAGEPRHVLMFQGIVDTYILPPIANATSLSLGLDLAGDALDAGHPELAEFEPLGTLLEVVGRQQISLPVTGNRGPATAVVIQHSEDGLEDGHEVMYQTDPPQRQIRCFLETLAKTSVPTVCP